MKMILGLIEKIKINGKEISAKMDTGATRNSIDIRLAKRFKLGPEIKKTEIKSAIGTKIRPVVKAEIEIKGKKMKTFFNISDRKRMKYKVLIGREVLRKGFVVDPSKK